MADSGLVFVIDGSEYPAPTLDTFDMAERRVMFELAGIVEEDFLREDDESEDDRQKRVTKLTRHPGFMEALMHVAYARGNPELKRAKVQELIDRTNYQDAIHKWGEEQSEDDAVPPELESTSEPEEASLSETVDSSTSSGHGSSNGSEQQDSTHEPTGTSPSDTSPTSALRVLA